MLATADEATGRVGLSELVHEGIYKININKPVESALLEVNEVLTMNIPELTSEQESVREQISTKIWQACDNAKLDFQIDERIDKKTFRQGRLAAMFSAKLALRE